MHARHQCQTVKISLVNRNRIADEPDENWNAESGPMAGRVKFDIEPSKISATSPPFSHESSYKLSIECRHYRNRSSPSLSQPIVVCCMYKSRRGHIVRRRVIFAEISILPLPGTRNPTRNSFVRIQGSLRWKLIVEYRNVPCLSFPFRTNESMWSLARLPSANHVRQPCARSADKRSDVAQHIRVHIEIQPDTTGHNQPARVVPEPLILAQGLQMSNQSQGLETTYVSNFDTSSGQDSRWPLATCPCRSSFVRPFACERTRAPRQRGARWKISRERK